MADDTATALPDATDSAEHGFLDDLLVYLLACASEQTNRGLHAQIKARGLGISDWRVLLTISDGPLSVGRLAELMFMQQPTLTKLLDRMERAGTVARKADPADGRRVLVSATKAGRALIAELQPLAKAHERRMLSAYSTAEAAALKHTLRTLIERTG